MRPLPFVRLMDETAKFHAFKVLFFDDDLSGRAVLKKQVDSSVEAIWGRPDHITGYANAPGPNRLFSCREAEGTSTELVEVGDLSCWKTKPDRAVVGLF